MVICSHLAHSPISRFNYFCEIIIFRFSTEGGFQYLLSSLFYIFDYVICQLIFHGVELNADLFDYLFELSPSKIFYVCLVSSGNILVCSPDYLDQCSALRHDEPTMPQRSNMSMFQRYNMCMPQRSNPSNPTHLAQTIPTYTAQNDPMLTCKERFYVNLQRTILP